MVKGTVNKTEGKCSCPEGKQCCGCKKKHQTFYRNKPRIVVESPKVLPVPIKISKHRETSPRSFRFPTYKSKKPWNKQTTEEKQVETKGRFSKLVTSLKTSKAHGDSKEDTRIAKEYSKKKKEEDKKAAKEYERRIKEDRKSVKELETWRREEEKTKLALEKAQREREVELLEQIKKQQKEQEKAQRELEEQLLEQLRIQQQKELEQAEKAEKEKLSILVKLAKKEAEKPKNVVLTIGNAATESPNTKFKKQNDKDKSKAIRESPLAIQDNTETTQPAKKSKVKKEKPMKKSKVRQEEVRIKTIKRVPFKTRMSNCFYRFCCEFYCWMTIILLVGLIVILVI